MEANDTKTLQINFNCWKHHAGYIIAQIKSVNCSADIETLIKHLLRIGNSQMDIYFGDYSVEEIAKQLFDYLQRNKIYTAKEYQRWIVKDKKDYQLVKLNDKSIWTLRLGESNEKYVHIHPGRYSPHTLRAKAVTLKCAIMVLTLYKLELITSINTESVNMIRKKYLNEPPLKSISKAAGLVRLIDLFQKI